MVSPIIASLGAATLLLASCCFTSITGVDDNNYETNNEISQRIQQDETDIIPSARIQLDGSDDISMRIQPIAKPAPKPALKPTLQMAPTPPPPPPPPPQGTQGYVRRSNYSAPESYNEKPKPGKLSKGSRSLNGGGISLSGGTRGQSDTEDYADVSVTAATLQIDMAEDFDQWEINEYEDPVAKTYHCSVQPQNKNDTIQPNLEMIKFLDDNGLAAVRPRKNYYQVRQIRQRMCQFGFNPFAVDTRAGSIHKRFKNTLRLMIYNTPGMFPGLKVIRNDLDRKRKREPQIWFKFETSSGPLISEFDYDNYFVTVSGDFARIQAYSKMLVALKMHKRLNSFNDSVSYKINLDLGIIEVILSSFGIALMRDKSTTNLMVKALNGVRTEINSDGEVQLEFEESLKDAADQVDPLLYSSIWLLSMAEKYEVVRIRDRSRSTHDKGVSRQESGRLSRGASR